MKLQRIIVVLGPPGSGKGTQSSILAAALNYEQIVLGDLIREFIKGDSEEAVAAKERYDKGIPQPDEIATALLKHKLENTRHAEGAVFDTYPLSMGQAKSLDKIAQKLRISFLRVIFLNVNKEEVVKRITQRKNCTNCKRATLFGQKGYDENICLNCGGGLIIRSDDTAEIAAERFDKYEERNEPIKEYYRNNGLLIEVNGDQPIDDVHLEIMNKLTNIMNAEIHLA